VRVCVRACVYNVYDILIGIVQLLLRHGADAFKVDGENKTALDQVFFSFCVVPRTEEIGLKRLRLPKYPTSFHRSSRAYQTLRAYQTRFHGSLQNLKQVFIGANTRLSKDLSGKLIDLDIQIFQV